jgi:UDP-2,3-diacylglucosamine pyrophosphatase LpxH
VCNFAKHFVSHTFMNSSHYRTIVLSDIHLGAKGSKVRQVTKFLKNFSCDRLILNGDIIDGWQLKKGGNTWKRKHTTFFRVVLKMAEKGTKVVYLRGNHDDFLDQVIPFTIGKSIRIVRDYILESGERRFFITHGDVFDSITSQMKWLAYLGDIGYNILLSLNKIFNQYRRWRGLPYYSLSQEIKQRVKAAVNYISDFEEKLVTLAKAHDCQGIICGHIHKPSIQEIDGVLYLNSGDWVESMTALVEDSQGRWSLVYWQDDQQDLDSEDIPGEEEDESFSPEIFVKIA